MEKQYNRQVLQFNFHRHATNALSNEYFMEGTLEAL